MAVAVTKNKTRVCPEYEDENLSVGLVKVIHGHLSTISTIMKVLIFNNI